MKKKLLVLDLLLLALVVITGERTRQRWLEARKREAAVFGQRLEPLPPPPYTPLPPVPKVTAAEYNEVAQQMLFSADRNPTVTVEVVRPPMPKLPVFYGLVNLGSGPFAIMSVQPGAEHKPVRFGEKIGEFKLVSAGQDQIVLEWEGEQVVRKTAELMVRTEEPQQAAAPPPKPAVQPAKPATNVITPAKREGPGEDIGGGRRACQPGDTSPAGTIMDGYRKFERDTPFGKMCHWEPVK